MKTFGNKKQKKDKKIEPIFNGNTKLCYAKLYERRQEMVDSECDKQAIEYHLNIDILCLQVKLKLIISQLLISKGKLLKAPQF
jgi:hypothetical protein